MVHRLTWLALVIWLAYLIVAGLNAGASVWTIAGLFVGCGFWIVLVLGPVDRWLYRRRVRPHVQRLMGLRP